MQFSKLAKGILIKRYKRFLADVDFGGSIETVHCPNPGAMIGVRTPGMAVWCSTSDNPNRKLPKTLELVENDGALIGINTNIANKLTLEALESKIIPAFADCEIITPEFTYEKGTRFDFKLTDKNGTDIMLEVKNVQMHRPDGPNPDAIEFPDSVTARGTKHLQKLTEIAKSGGRAAMLYVIQRNDAKKFTIAGDIDPLYGDNFKKAINAGVDVMAWRCQISTENIALYESVIIKDP